MTTLSKHVDKATAIRGHYKFKHAAVRIVMKASGYSEGIYDGHFDWEGSYIQGRQLATADLIPYTLYRPNGLACRNNSAKQCFLACWSSRLGWTAGARSP